MIAHRTNTTPLGRCTKIVVFTLALAAFVAPGTLHAQAGGGSLVASASVLPPPVTGTGMQELKFGSVRPGDVVDVPPGPAAGGATLSSAGWHFGNIRKGRWVALDLTLPTHLTHGASLIPIDWDNPDYGLLCVSGNSGVCQMTGSLNPGAWPSLLFRLDNSLQGNNFDVRLYAGARVTIPANLPPGVYAASVTAVFAYVT